MRRLRGLVKTTITTTRTKTVWYLKLMLMVSTSFEVEGWEVYLTQRVATNASQWSEELQGSTRTLFLSGAQMKNSCPTILLLGLFSRAVAQDGTMSCWNSIVYPAADKEPHDAWSMSETWPFSSWLYRSKLLTEATYGTLKLNPCWDPLRKDPGFDRLLAELARRD